MADPDPEYFALVPRETVERLAQGTDDVARWAAEMLSSRNEEAVFLRGARSYFQRCDQTRRRKAIGFLALTFGVKHADMKRYLRFKGIVNLTD